MFVNIYVKHARLLVLFQNKKSKHSLSARTGDLSVNSCGAPQNAATVDCCLAVWAPQQACAPCFENTLPSVE